MRMWRNHKICSTCVKREYCRVSKYRRETMTFCHEYVLDEAMFEPCADYYYCAVKIKKK